MKARPVIDRLLDKVEMIPLCGCWIWTGASVPGGYGIIGHGTTERGNARMVYVHRVAYEHFVGPIPHETELCHRCDVSACCNPAHLFPGTHTDNMRDMADKGRGNAGLTNCRRGHELAGDNLRIRPDGRRYCHQCKMDSQRNRRAS